DRDPCELHPCKNGATCKAKYENKKSSHECFCATGFGGPTCSERPCDSAPCQNNGTCRTTAAASTYFCDCQHDFGGKNCEFEIGKPSNNIENFGSEVEQVSSGKAEWVEEMKSRLAGAKKPSSKEKQADEQYKDPETKKRERAQREKQQEEESQKLRDEKAKQAAEEAARIAEEEAKQKLEAELQQKKNGCTLSISPFHLILSLAFLILF
ncbi:hypothetical protein PFISCL1PPCAC_1257, partial [Pristionchus fissidentatus]